MVMRARAVLDTMNANSTQQRAGEKAMVRPKRKRCVRFDSPRVHHFSKESPAKRRIVTDDGESTQTMQNDQLTIELEEYGLSQNGSREEKISRLDGKINEDLNLKLASYGLVEADQTNLGHRQLRRKTDILRELERKARVVLIYGEQGLPSAMDMSKLRKELKMRRLSDTGTREQLEVRLEHALLKDDCAHVEIADDGYAFGRVEVDMEDVLMSKPDKELRRLLKEEHHYSEKIPTKKEEKVAILKAILDKQMDVDYDEAFEAAQRACLRQLKLPVVPHESKAAMFLRLENELTKSELDGKTLWAFESMPPSWASPKASPTTPILNKEVFKRSGRSLSNSASMGTPPLRQSDEPSKKRRKSLTKSDPCLAAYPASRNNRGMDGKHWVSSLRDHRVRVV